MGQIYFSGILAVLLAACASEPPAPPPPGGPDALRALALTDDTAVQVARSLVREVGPRFAGTPGSAKSVEWAQAKLRELGFQNVHAEPVTVPVWDRGQAAVELEGSGKALDVVALGGSVATSSRGAIGEVLAVPTIEALAALPDAAVKDKIVYFSNRMQRTRDGAGYAKAVPARRKGPSAAARKGARAVLIRSVGTDSDGPPHTGKTFYEDGVVQIPAAALSTRAADQLEAELAKGPVKARLAMTSAMKGTAQAFNVVGEIPGETPELVLFGAHLDSWDITPGANDDAAGVGIVVAAARRVGRLGKPHRTLRVVLFANEEFGADGSKAYAAAHAAEAPRIALLLEADSGSGVAWRLNGGVAAADWPRVAQLATDLQLEAGANGKSGGTDVEPLRKL